MKIDMGDNAHEMIVPWKNDDLREKVICELVQYIESALAIDSDYVDCVRTDLLQTVVGLLKLQQPRVMTMEEAISDYVGTAYYESKFSSIVLTGYVDSIRDGRCEIATIGSEETEKEMLSDYGIKWRFWTSYPTDEQREAAQWAK